MEKTQTAKMEESTILIADDDAVARRLMKTVLSQEGYRLAFANSGVQALEKATELTPDLILLDVMMPDMRGFEVCQRLRDDPLLAEVPIIMVTALADRESRARGLEVGADDFITKPFDTAELRARVRTITRLNRYRLLLKRAKFERLVEGSPDGLLLIGSDGAIRLANPTALQMLSVEKNDIVGQEISNFIVAEDIERCLGYFEEAIADSPRKAPIEARFTRADGERFPAEVSASHFLGYRETAVQVVIRDVTERKQAEEALRQYAEEQTALYTIASVAATELDPDNLLKAVLEVLRPVLNADATWVTLVGRSLNTSYSHIAAWHGVPESFVRAQQDIPLKDCPICRPVLATDAPMADHQRLLSDTLKQAGLHSHVGVPLGSGDEVLGVLHVGWRDPRSHFESESLLRTIGQQVSLALRNAQLYQTTRQVDRLQAINKLDRALAATLDPEEVTEVALKEISEVLNTPVSLLFLFPPSDKVHPLRCLTLSLGWAEVPPAGEEIQHLHDLLQRMREQHTYVDLLTSDEVGLISGQQSVTQHWGGHNLVVPIWDGEKPVALFMLGGRPFEQPFIDEDRALARAAADRMGQAIQNARLYQASQEQSMRLITLNAISTAAVSSLELDVILRRVLTLTRQALGAAVGSVLVYDPDEESLVFVMSQADIPISLRGHRLALGQGIAGWVVEQRQPTYVNDVRQDPRWGNEIDEIANFPISSLMCAPLKHRDRVTGAIEVINKREGQFNEDDLSLLEAVSSIVAAAMENARLYADIKARASELALLNDIGVTLTSTLDYSTVVQAALSQVRHLFYAEHVSLLQPDPQTGRLSFVKAVTGNMPIDRPVADLTPGEGIGGWVLEQRQSLLITDAQADPRFQDWVAEHSERPARALMAVPLIARERVIGIIEVISSEPGIYTRDDLHTLQALAATLAVALENAGLYDELRSLLREREKAQAQLIHAEKMTAMGQLAASITHEINNPLQAVLSYLALAQEELEETNDKEQMRRHLGIVGDELERIANIVRRIRDFYRPANEGFRSVHPHEVLKSVLELTEKQLQHGDVTLVCEWSETLPHIQANPDHLKQVFLNLVLNAIDAMPTGGTLHILTAPAQIQEGDDEREPQPAVLVAFSDTGEGIPPDVLPQLFEPFFTTKERGMGLGLFISYRIIQSHGGQITVQSHIGMGTTFDVLLPVDQRAKEDS